MLVVNHFTPGNKSLRSVYCVTTFDRQLQRATPRPRWRTTSSCCRCCVIRSSVVVCGPPRCHGAVCGPCCRLSGYCRRPIDIIFNRGHVRNAAAAVNTCRECSAELWRVDVDSTWSVHCGRPLSPQRRDVADTRRATTRQIPRRTTKQQFASFYFSRRRLSLTCCPWSCTLRQVELKTSDRRCA